MFVPHVSEIWTKSLWSKLHEIVSFLTRKQNKTKQNKQTKKQQQQQQQQQTRFLKTIFDKALTPFWNTFFVAETIV